MEQPRSGADWFHPPQEYPPNDALCWTDDDDIPLGIHQDDQVEGTGGSPRVGTVKSALRGRTDSQVDHVEHDTPCGPAVSVFPRGCRSPNKKPPNGSERFLLSTTTPETVSTTASRDSSFTPDRLPAVPLLDSSAGMITTGAAASANDGNHQHYHDHYQDYDDEDPLHMGDGGQEDSFLFHDSVPSSEEELGGYGFVLSEEEEEALFQQRQGHEARRPTRSASRRSSRPPHHPQPPRKRKEVVIRVSPNTVLTNEIYLQDQATTAARASPTPSMHSSSSSSRDDGRSTRMHYYSSSSSSSSSLGSRNHPPRFTSSRQYHHHQEQEDQDYYAPPPNSPPSRRSSSRHYEPHHDAGYHPSRPYRSNATEPRYYRDHDDDNHGRHRRKPPPLRRNDPYRPPRSTTRPRPPPAGPYSRRDMVHDNDDNYYHYEEDDDHENHHRDHLPFDDMDHLPPPRSRARPPPPPASSRVAAAAAGPNTSNEVKLVEISPGFSVPLRGAKETRDYIAQGLYVSLRCFACTLDLFGIPDAAYILCPVCRVVNPLEQCCDPGGLGLGFTQKEVLAVERELAAKGTLAQQKRRSRARPQRSYR